MDFLKSLFAKVLALLTTTTTSPTVNVEVKVNEAVTPAVLPVKKARKSKSPATKKGGTKKKPALRVE